MNTALLITAGAIALIGHTAFVSGLLLSLKNRRRRSHYREREAWLDRRHQYYVTITALLNL